MIFRDLIPAEEFVVGENVYSTLRKKNLILDTIDNNILSCDEHQWYTMNGLYYRVCDTTYYNIKEWYKQIVTNNMYRIIPIKYKPL